ncbi:dihydroorotate dehydrogenase electron transfer subunit, partial [Verrucomicrobiota bacterium]
ILYKPVGRGTAALALVSGGEEVSLIGPLGRGFPYGPNAAFPVLVGGGYGVAPLYFLAARMNRKGILFVGGAGKADILCVSDFEALGWDVRVATEDGSMGEKGLVTDILDKWLEGHDGAAPEFHACGPDGMLKAVGDRAEKGSRTAWLSLDKHMGCGVGACLACVQKIRDDDGSERWGRVCTDGPVFESREIVW